MKGPIGFLLSSDRLVMSVRLSDSWFETMPDGSRRDIPVMLRRTYRPPTTDGWFCFDLVFFILAVVVAIRKVSR